MRRNWKIDFKQAIAMVFLFLILSNPPSQWHLKAIDNRLQAYMNTPKTEEEWGAYFFGASLTAYILEKCLTYNNRLIFSQTLCNVGYGVPTVTATTGIAGVIYVHPEILILLQHESNQESSPEKNLKIEEAPRTYTYVDALLYLILIVFVGSFGGLTFLLIKVIKSQNPSFRFVPNHIKQRLFLLARDRKTAQRLIKDLRNRYPKKDELWYWEKAIRDLERDRH